MKKMFITMGIAFVLTVGVVFGMSFMQFDETDSNVSHEVENTVGYETQLTQKACAEVEDLYENEYIQELMKETFSK